MKTNLILAAILTLALTAQATVYNSGNISVGQVIPDGNPVGYTTSYTFSTGDANTINGVTVTLDISGGYSGDLYGYLVNPNGSMAVLLNRVGTGGGNAYGYSDAGMNVVLNETGVGSIHSYQSVPGYDITSGTMAFTPDNGTGDFSALHNGTVNGTWTLFLADLSAGGQATLVNWGLDVSVVPEPTTWALISFGGMAGLTILIRRRSDAGKIAAKIMAWVDAV
jgi:subtilisin-like proprotein convertase family protein